MKASEVIKRLQRIMDTYGDWEVVFRDCDGEYYDPHADISSVYADDESERIVVSDNVDWHDEDSIEKE